MKKDKDLREESDGAPETFAECNKEADEKYFTLQPGKIIFHKPFCFPHAFRNLDINMDVTLTYAQVMPYLSIFGKKALSQNSEIIKTDFFHSIRKPMYGSIDNKYNIVMQFDELYGNTIIGVYYYGSQGICIEISGTMNGKNIALSENDEKGETVAVFNGEISETIITGTWTELKSGKQLPFSVKN